MTLTETYRYADPIREGVFYVTPDDFDPEMLAKAIEVEKEHTDDHDEALAVVMDHLREDPAYYEKLWACGLGLEAVGEARDYEKEYADRSPEQKQNRVKRAKARREAGLKPGDPREVDHKRPLSKGGSNGPRNIRVVSQATNRAKGAQEDVDEVDESRKRVQITQGMAKAMGKGGPARVCRDCSLAVPRYPGRYPATCPACGGTLSKPKAVYEADLAELKDLAVAQLPKCAVCGAPAEFLGAVPKRDGGFGPERGLCAAHARTAFPQGPVAEEPRLSRRLVLSMREGVGEMVSGMYGVVVAVSSVPRIQRLIEKGVLSADEHIDGDGSTSRSRVLTFEDVEQNIAGGLSGLLMFLECPAPKTGRHYRVEGVHDPVLVWEVDDVHERVRVYATSRPERALGFDPRAEIAEADLNELACDGGMQQGGAGGGFTRKDISSPRDPSVGAQRAVGRYRFELGANRKADPRIDVQRSLQNTRNARRGLASRIKAAKEWHGSSRGKSLHAALNRYNSGNHKGQPIGPGTRTSQTRVGAGAQQRENVNEDDIDPLAFAPAVAADDVLRAVISGEPLRGHRFAKITTSTGQIKVGSTDSDRLALVGTPDEVARALNMGEHVTESGGVGILPMQSAAYPEQKTLDDAFDAILRKLITIESQDILQDVEFTNEGGIFLYFDPSISDQEMSEVLNVIHGADPKIILVGTPDGRLEGEQYPAQWWVCYLPPKEEAMLQGPPHARGDDEEREPEAPKQQGVVMGGNTVDQVAGDIDLGAAVGAVGESLREGETTPRSGSFVLRGANGVAIATVQGALVGPFGIHGPSGLGDYTLTHLPTGAALTHGTKANMLAAAEELVAGPFDWSAFHTVAAANVASEFARGVIAKYRRGGTTSAAGRPMRSAPRVRGPFQPRVLPPEQVEPEPPEGKLMLYWTEAGRRVVKMRGLVGADTVGFKTWLDMAAEAKGTLYVVKASSADEGREKIMAGHLRPFGNVPNAWTNLDDGGANTLMRFNSQVRAWDRAVQQRGRFTGPRGF